MPGLILQWLHICPIVKRIWTSSYTLYSGGLVILMLAGFYALIEWKGWRRWAFPLLVIGANSIAIYVMSWTIEHFVSVRAGAAPGAGAICCLGAPFEPVLRGMGVLIVFWAHSVLDVPQEDLSANLILTEGLRPSDSPTRALARRFDGSLRSRGLTRALVRHAAACAPACSTRELSTRARAMYDASFRGMTRS